MDIKKYHHRCQLISLLDKGFLTANQSAKELSLSESHTRKLLAKFRKGGRKLSTLLFASRPKAWNKLNQEIIDEITRLKKERPERSNQHIAEMIEGKFGKQPSEETVRLTLIRNDCYENAKRERRVFQNLEGKITHSGQMIQFDACEGAWLEGYRRIYLIAFLDAYSRYIVSWKWVESNSAWNSILVLRSVVRKYGCAKIYRQLEVGGK